MTNPTLDWLRSEMEDARGRCEAATEGPWRSRDGDASVSGCTVMGTGGRGDELAVTVSPDNSPADATFIAHARRDLPAALSVLDRIGTELADADIDTLFDALDQLEEACGPEVVEVFGALRDVALRREERE